MAKHGETSFWKKEIGFGRKQKQPKQGPSAEPVFPEAAEAAKPADTSVWKKEISFGRKGKQNPPKPKPVSLPPVEAPAVAAAAPEPEAKTSVWKKDIGFGRKSKPKAEAPVEAPVATAAAVAASEPKASVWKKDIGFRRKSKPKDEQVEATAPPAEQVEAVETQPEPVHAATPVSPPVEPVPDPVVPDPAPPVSVEPSFLPVEADLPSAEPELGPVPPPVTPTAEPVPPVVPVAAQPYAPPYVPPAVPDEPVVDAGDVLAVAAVAAVETDHAELRDTPAEPVDEPQPEPVAEAPKQSRSERREAKRADKGSKKNSNQLVGLKLGASQIAAAQVVNKGGPKVVRMARQSLKRGVVVGGELREPEELASQLKAFFRKNKLPRNCVRLGISNNRIGVRTFEISGISDPKQLDNAVRFQAQETLPIPLDEAVLDYRILDDRVGDDGARVCRVLLVVAHRELVERYVSACRKAGLKLVGIDLEAFALLRALSDPTHPPGEDAAVVCVSIGHDRSTLAVSDGRLCEFTRVLAWGGSALDSALARVLDITPSEAVPVKHALSLAEDGEAAGLDARHADEARRAMVAELQSFARELVASLRFYQEQPKSLGIVEIMITGGAAACGGLAPELERLIGIPVRVADPLTRVKVQKAPEGDAAASTASMAVAVGLGIED
jgi:type IV pilus assembly protein PilM